jgi:hypothetical protein
MEVITISLISDKLQEDMRFYYGWGSLACMFGISLLIFAASGNISLAISLFFIGLGISLILISVSEPKMPLIIASGIALVLFGGLIYGISVAQFNPVILIALVIIVIGGGIILLSGRSVVEK